MKLIGIMSDGTSDSLANITRQLTQINERLAVMDKKLDDISRQMSEMQAAEVQIQSGIKLVDNLERVSDITPSRECLIIVDFLHKKDRGTTAVLFFLPIAGREVIGEGSVHTLHNPADSVRAVFRHRTDSSEKNIAGMIVCGGALGLAGLFLEP